MNTYLIEELKEQVKEVSDLTALMCAQDSMGLRVRANALIEELEPAVRKLLRDGWPLYRNQSITRDSFNTLFDACDNAFSCVTWLRDACDADAVAWIRARSRDGLEDFTAGLSAPKKDRNLFELDALGEIGGLYRGLVAHVDALVDAAMARDVRSYRELTARRQRLKCFDARTWKRVRESGVYSLSLSAADPGDSPGAMTVRILSGARRSKVKLKTFDGRWVWNRLRLYFSDITNMGDRLFEKLEEKKKGAHLTNE